MYVYIYTRLYICTTLYIYRYICTQVFWHAPTLSYAYHYQCTNQCLMALVEIPSFSNPQHDVNICMHTRLCFLCLYICNLSNSKPDALSPCPVLVGTARQCSLSPIMRLRPSCARTYLVKLGGQTLTGPLQCKYQYVSTPGHVLITLHIGRVHVLRTGVFRTPGCHKPHKLAQ